MRNKIWMTALLVLITGILFAQQPTSPTGGSPQAKTERKPLRIVDSISAKEKDARVILRSELDSLIRQYTIAQAPVTIKEPPVKETVYDSSIYVVAGLIVVLLVVLSQAYLFYKQQYKMSRRVADLSQQLSYLQLFSPVPVTPSLMAKEKTPKTKSSAQTLENKINDLNGELHKLTRENESLSRVVKEYNGIQHEYDSLKHGISKAYKIKNYPGFEKNKSETTLMQGVLDTENSVANYAYEKFLKPILAITDANKNNPARTSDEDERKLLDLLVSLAFLYIEYLYLRVNDLAIGGKMVERIKSFKNGNGIDTSLLKELNTENGSRALVVRMLLDKASLQTLSYPVFDETNLNQ